MLKGELQPSKGILLNTFDTLTWTPSHLCGHDCHSTLVPRKTPIHNPHAHPPIHLHYPYSFCIILPCFLDEWVQQFLKLLPESLISHGIEGAQVFFHSFRADVLVVHRGAQARQSFKDLNLGGAELAVVVHWVG